MSVFLYQAETLDELILHLRHTTEGVLLVAATSDADSQRLLTQVLSERLAGEMTFHSFRFHPDRLSLTAHIRSLPSHPAGPNVLLVEGLDDLPDRAREQALASLNLERETLRWVGYSILLWVRPRTLTELPFKAGDFWAWRSGSFLFDESVLRAVAPERLPPPEEVERLRKQAEEYKRELTHPDLASRLRARMERELALVQRQLSLVALREAATAEADRAWLRVAYCTHLADSFRWLDFRGILQTRKPILLPLEQVFVALRAVPQVRTEKELPSTLERTVAEERASYAAEARRERWEIKDALAERRHLVILGDPGSGKTTLLKYLALTMTEGPEAVRARLDLEEGPLLPIIFPLSAFAAVLAQEPDLSLDDYLPRHFAALGLPGLGGLFAEELAAGHCLVLLDGLDEVPTRQQRSQVVRRVHDFVARHGANRFVVTSRIVGYGEEPLGEKLAHFTIAEWGDREIAEFARQWCVAYERQADDSPEAVRRGQDEAERLIAAIQSNASVRRLASNPLLLTIIALIHRQGTRLPQHRIQLYALTFQTLIETWNRARSLEGRPLSVEGMSEHEAVQILAPLALWMHETQPSGTARREEMRVQIAALLEEEEGPERAQEAADRFLDLVRRQVGLLVERGEGRFGFMHLTFEEYLAARAIVMAGQVDLRRTVEQVLRHLEEPAWHEVIRLAVGQLGVVGAGRDAAAAIVEAILDAPGSPQARGQHAVLAGGCLMDVGEKGVTRTCWKLVIAALIRTMQDMAPDGCPNDPSLPIPIRYAAAETLDRLGWLPEDLNAWVEVKVANRRSQIAKRVYVGRYPVTNAQFALFVADGGYEERGKRWWSDEGWEWRKKGERRWSDRGTDQPEYWDDPRFGKSRRGYPIVGVSWYEAMAYCAWLTGLLCRYRAGEELEPIYRDLVAGLPEDAAVVRLPTEKEWIAAAGGAEEERYPWGTKWDESRANTSEGGIGGTTPVGMYPSGQSPHGVWDLGGNVWEWMASEGGEYPLRGGSWVGGRGGARVGARGWDLPDGSSHGLGLRVVGSPASPGS